MFFEQIAQFSNSVAASTKLVTLDEVAIDEFVALHTPAIQELQTQLLKTKRHSVKESQTLVQNQLILNSVNFCYWAGQAHLRPAGGGAGLLYQLFRDLTGLLTEPDELIGTFEELLSAQRFPLMQERSTNLRQLKVWIKHRGNLSKLTEELLSKTLTIDDKVKTLTKECPYFGGDIFLKRASLLLQSLRYHEHISIDTSKLPTPIDYHIPAILNDVFPILKYSPELQAKLEGETLLPSLSKEEIAIRALAYKACNILAEKTGAEAGVIDQYLFAFRHDERRKTPHHLTVTTDY